MASLAFVCLALLATVSAVPTGWIQDGGTSNSYSCALQCRNLANKFQYKPQTTYLYEYKVDTETSMAGATADSAKLSIQARAEIQVIDGCEFALKLQEVRISHSDAYSGQMKPAAREDEFREALESNILRFSFDDGIISNVCPDSRESTWTVNFKRGLLSALQNSLDDFDGDQTVTEVDVIGQCEAVYNISKVWRWGRERKITKTKDLLSCTKHNGYKSMLQLTAYKVPSEIQSLPVMKGSHKCESSINPRNILDSVTCEETHIYVPFSNRESGGRTRVVQKLTLKGQKETVDVGTALVQDRRDLLFEHVSSEGEIENTWESAEQKLKELCDQTRESIRPETPRLYSELVRIVKLLSKADLENLYRRLKEKQICPNNVRSIKLFLDALPMAGTAGPVGLMASLINSKDVEGLLAKAWITSIALIQDPDPELIREAAAFLRGSFADDALLPVSALVGTYCKKLPDCGNDYYVSEITDFLQNKIPYSCQTDDKNIKSLLKTLKAIGNAGQTNIVSSLDKCLTSNDAPLEVKVAAADAYRRIPCEQNDNLWLILNDPSQDFELRIATYLAVMRCPDSDTLEKIFSLLSSLKDEQVGSFIYSHLNNLKETSDPLKQDVAKAISNLSLKEFSQNPIKLSSNHEASFLLNKLNLGFTADSNLIMNTKSAFPRSAMANLTFHLFGNSVNVLEIGGRVEGIEHLVEWLLGSLGMASNTANDKKNKKLADVTGSVYTRVFGNEIFYERVKGLQGLQTQGKMPNFLDLLIKLANRQDIAYTHSEQIMDVSLIVPTIAGLPLNISVNGSLNLDLKAEGKADLRRVSSSPRSLEIDGEFKPSAALEITGTMSVDAFIAKMGLRMRNTMHSSTGIKGHIVINRGRVLNVDIEPPRDQMEIFNAKSEFFIVHNEIEKYQDMIKENRKEYKVCTGDKVATILGVELCAELQFPYALAHSDAPYFPLTGPASISFVTYRRDTHTSYKLFATRDETEKSTEAKFLMDTPNSKINRMISSDLTIKYSPDKTIALEIVSPWRKIKYNSNLVTNKDMVSVGGIIVLDDRDKYGLTTEIKINKDGTQMVYTPFVELTLKGRTDILLSGQVINEFPRNFYVNLEFNGLQYQPVIVKGSLINREKEKRLQVSANLKDNKEYLLNIGTNINSQGKGDRNILIEPEIIVKSPESTFLSVTGSGNYKQEKSKSSGISIDGDLTVAVYRMKPITFELKSKSTAKNKNLRQHNVDFKVKSSLVTGSVEVLVNQLKTSITSKVKMNYNIPQLGKDTVTWNTKLSDKSKNTLTKYSLTSNVGMLMYPEYNTGLTVDVDHKKKVTSVDVEVSYGSNPKDKKKKVSLSTSLYHNIKNLKVADLDIKVEAKYPQQDVDLALKVSHSHTLEKLNSNLDLRFAPFLKSPVAAAINLQDKSSKFFKYVGKANLAAMDRKFSVDTVLTQKSSSQYEHSLDVFDSQNSKHSINTVYKSSKWDEHDITSQINIEGFHPIQLEGKLALDPSNFQASGKAVKGMDVYSLSAQAKFVQDKAGKWSLDMLTPYRQIEAAVDAKRVKDKIEGSLTLDWDAARKMTKSKIYLDGAFKYSASSSSSTRIISGNVNVITPFSNFESWKAEAIYNSDESQYSSKGKLSWGSKAQSISSSLVIKRPISYRNVQLRFTADTPIRKYREIELEIDHKMDPVFDFSVKGGLEDKKNELSIKGEDRSTGSSTDFYGLLDLKSSFPILTDFTAFLEHKDDGKVYTTNGLLSHNRKTYKGNLNMDNAIRGSSVTSNGDLKLTWPEDTLVTTWNHQLTGITQIQSDLTSTWSGNKQLTMTLSGTNKGDAISRQIKGSVSIQTPWRDSQDILISFDKKYEPNKLIANGVLRNNKVDKIVYDIVLERDSKAENANVKFLLQTPLYDHKIHGQTQVKANSFSPTTAFAWFEWAPWSRIDLDSSLNAPSTDNLELNVKLTTPFKSFANIIVTSSHKLEISEYVTHAVIDYGVQNMIEFENRFRFDEDTQLLRTKLTSPYSYLKSLTTGVRLVQKPSGVEGTADFQLLPYVEKYDGFVSLDYSNSNLNGKLRVNTPHKNLPSVQITAWSKSMTDSSRTSHLDLDSTYGTYSMDTSYRFDLPFNWDVKLKTPHSGFDDVGFTAKLNPSASGLQSSLKVVYLSLKEINTQLQLNWDSKFEGNLIVNTPFRGYERNKILLRHDGSSREFTCHGEGQIGRQRAEADVSYKVTHSTMLGSASLLTPISGYEKISGTFMLQGDLTKFKTNASLTLGSDTMNAAFSSTYRSGSLKSNIRVYTPYTKDLTLTLQHEDTSSSRDKKFKSSFDFNYGKTKSDGRLIVSYARLNSCNVELSVNTPFKSVSVSIANMMTGDDLSVKGAIKSDCNIIGNTEFSFTKTGPQEDMTVNATAVRNSELVMTVMLENHMLEDEVHVKIVTQGKFMPIFTAEMDNKGSLLNFNRQVRLSDSSGNIFDLQSTVKLEDTVMDVKNQFSYRLNHNDNTFVLTMHKEGTWTDFKIDISEKLNGKEVKSKVEFEAEEKIRVVLQIDNLADEYRLIAVEFEHSGDTEKFITSGHATLNNDIVSGKVNFYKYDLRRIEVSAELTTPWDNYKYSKIEYRHEGETNMLTCSGNIIYGKNQKISSDLIFQSAPTHSLVFNLKTPFKGYEEIMVSGDYDDVKTNGKAKLGQGIELTIKQDSYNCQCWITTPFDLLRKASLRLTGKPLDGQMDLEVKSWGKTITSKGVLKYINIYSSSISGEMRSDIQGLEYIKLALTNDNDAFKGKTTHLEIGWDPKQQMIVDGRYLFQESSWTSSLEQHLELDITLPFEKVRNISINLLHNSESSTKLDLDYNLEKVVDIEFRYESGSTQKYSVLLHQPAPMEYTGSYQGGDYDKEAEVFINWNKDEPSSNIRIRGVIKDSPASSYSNDRSVVLTLIHPSRTVGVEHMLSISTNKISSSGQVYWDQGDKSKVFYSLDVTDNTYRRDKTYDCLFKLGLPTRTLGMSGSIRNNDVTKSADAAFKWDLDRDDSRQIGIKASMTGREYTKADFSLNLPENLQVVSALILNQGNTIFDGKTDISYSRDARKTLTLFSKVKNSPSSYSYFATGRSGFNYSVEFGVSHPETKVDVKIDSHIGKSDDILTSSLGIQYLTIARQRKNLALFAEIDKLRKQISLLASSPSSSVGVSGRVTRDDPLNVEVVCSKDGQETIKSTLDIDTNMKTLKCEIGQPKHLVSINAFYPNNSALLAELHHKKDSSDNTESVMSVHLVNPKLLNTRIQWRPEMFGELKDYVIGQATTTTESAKQMLIQLNSDIKEEVTGKYKDITTSVVQDMQPLIRYTETELETLAKDLDSANQKLMRMYRNNDLYLWDISTSIANNYATVSKKYVFLRDEIQSLRDMYKQSYKSLISSISATLESVKTSPVGDIYSRVVSSSGIYMMQKVDDLLKTLISLKQEKVKLFQNSDFTFLSVEDVYKHTQLKWIREKVEYLKNFNPDDYVDKYSQALKNVDWTLYKNLLQQTSVSKYLPEDVRHAAEKASDKLYQQAKWAYHYLEVEENVKNHLKTAIKLLRDVVKVELNEYIHSLKTLVYNPIKVFDPQNGVIEFDLILPVAVQSLNELSDFTPYMDQFNNQLEKYFPSKGTMTEFTPVLGNTETYGRSDEDTVDSDNAFEDKADDKDTADDTFKDIDETVMVPFNPERTFYRRRPLISQAIPI